MAGISFSLESTGSWNQGQYDILVSLTNRNYALEGAEDNGNLVLVDAFTIERKSLTGTTMNIEYGDAIDYSGTEFKGSISGVIEGEEPDFSDLNWLTDYSSESSDRSDIGSYKIWLESKIDAGNYTFPEGFDIAVCVTQKEVTVNIDDQTSVYGAVLVRLTATDVALEGDIPYGLVLCYEPDPNKPVETTSDEPLDAGTYYIMGNTLDENYDITYSGSAGTYGIYVVSQLAISPEINTGITFEYDGEPKTAFDYIESSLAGYGLDESDVSFSYEMKNDNDEYESVEAPLEPGDYRAVPTFIGDVNYSVSTGFSITFEVKEYSIKKEDLHWVSGPFHYNGRDQKSSVYATFDEFGDDVVKFVYSVTKNDEETDFKDAGYYEFTIQLASDSSPNYVLDPAVDSVGYTMNQLPVIITADDYVGDKAVTYGDVLEYGYKTSVTIPDSQHITIGVVANGAIPGSSTPRVPIDGSVMEGALVVGYKWAEGYEGLGDNYDFTLIDGDLEVKKRQIALSNVTYTKMYDGEQIPSGNLLGVKYDISGGVLQSDSLNFTFSIASPIGPNAGTYKGAITLSEWAIGSYDVYIVEGKGSCIITPAKLYVEIAEYGHVGVTHDGQYLPGAWYDAGEHSPMESYLFRDDSGNIVEVDPMWVSWSYSIGGEAVETLINVGVYDLTYSVEVKNYDVYDDLNDTSQNSGNFQVTIQKAYNNWLNSADETGWTSDMEFSDATYPEFPSQPIIDSVFGESIDTKIYRVTDDGDIYMGAGWLPSANTDAGTYRVCVSVAEAENYYGLVADPYTFEIYKKPLNPYWAEESSLYSDSGTTNTLVGFDSTLMDVSRNQHDYVFENGKISMYAKEPGDYSIILTIKEEFRNNYRWIDADYEDSVSMPVIWTIVSSIVTNNWTLGGYPQIDSWNFNSKESTPFAQSIYGEPVFTYSSDSSTWMSEIPSDAGHYYMKATVSSGYTSEGSYYGQIAEVVEFDIYKQALTEPSLTIPMELVYNGGAQGFDAGDLRNFDSSMMVLSGNTSTEAGTHTALVKIKDDYFSNYCWTSTVGQTLEITWTIGSKQLAVPELSDEVAIVYDGSEQSILEYIADFDDIREYVSVMNYSGLAANSYVAIFSIINGNCVWEDGSKDSKIVDWTISKRVVSRPSFPGGSLDMDSELSGGFANMQIVGLDTSVMSIRSESGTYLTRNESSDSTLYYVNTNAANVYTITIGLLDNSNNVWNDGESDDTTLTWSVGVEAIDRPVVEGVIEVGPYTGSNYDVRDYICGFDPEVMEITGVCLESNAGAEYRVSITPKYGYSWSDGTDNPIEVVWKILPKNVELIWSAPTLTYNGESQLTSITAHFTDHDGKVQSVDVNLTDAVEFKDAGEYVFNAVSGGSNYIFSNPTHKYVISPMEISVNLQSITVEYGQPVDLIWTYAEGSSEFLPSDKIELIVNSDAFEGLVSGEIPAVGEYRIYFEKAVLNNYDVDFGNEAVLKIVPGKIQIPEAREVAYSGSEISSPFEDTETYSVSGDMVGTEVGEYVVTLTLKGGGNYVWSDGTTGPVNVIWSIVEARVLEYADFVLSTSSETYTGSEITKKVESVSGLVLGKDYVVSYIDNLSVGTARLVITGIGGYAGSLNYEFSIEQAKPTISFYNQTLRMYVEDDSFYNAVRCPAYVPEDALRYISSDDSIATVDQTTGAIIMNKIGTVTITVIVPGTANYASATATYELTVSDHPVEVVDHVVYVKVPVEVPGGDDDDDQTDDKPETVYIEKDNDLYIWLLIVMAVICVCFAAYILYSHRDQEGGA